MIFTQNKLKSRRFIQLEFKGFGSNKKIFLNFLLFLLKYIGKKIKDTVIILGKLILVIKNIPYTIKSYLTKKLIWSRGRLGRPVVNLVVMLVAFVIFMFGEVLNSTSFVSGGEVNSDYLTYTTDIIPTITTATTLVPESRKGTESFEYEVAAGDTISGIGEKFKISSDALKYVNNLTDYSILKIGQKITIPPVSGLIHKVEKGDSLESIAKKYDVPSQAIADFNYILDTSKLAIGTELVVPGAKVPEPIIIIPPTPAYITSTGLAQASPSKSFCVWPTSTRIITQYYAWYHNGVDISTPSGRGMPPVFACTGGTVTRAGWDPWGLGLHVRIDHGNGYETVYGHMSSINVSYGQSVSRGSVIGVMGSTGRSTGPHVHFMVNFNGSAQNPLNYTN